MDTKEIKQEDLDISDSDPSLKGSDKHLENSKAETQVSSSKAQERAAPQQPAALSPARFFVILIGLSLGLFMSLMNMSIVSTALYTISVDFKDYQKTIWVALSYTLADIGCAVFVTRLSDVFGRKTMIISSFFIFTCFSLASGLAKTVDELIVFRTLQGVGGSGLYALTMVICPQIAPPKLLPLVITILSITTAVAGVCGPVLGGIITGTTTWRWIFWLNVPIGGVAMVILIFMYPSQKSMPRMSNPAKLKQLDFLGALLNASASVCFIFCLEQVGTRAFRWNSPATIALLVISGASAMALILWQWYVSHGKLAKAILPQLPFRILRNRPMSLVILITILIGYAYFTAIFTIPVRYQVVDQNSPIRSGLRLLPLVVATALGSLVSGSAASRRPDKNMTFPTMIVATALTLLGTGLLSSLPSNGAPRKVQYVWEVFLGFGVGMAISTATFVVSIEAEFVDHAVAQGTIAQSRVLGGAIGIAVSTITMNNHLQTALEDLVSPEILRSLFVSPFTIREYDLTIAAEFRKSYIGAFKDDMRIAMYISLVAFVASLCAWQKNPQTIKGKREKLAAAMMMFAAQAAQAAQGKESESHR